MAPDLPLELWMKILSYLPPGTARSMLTVSRQLFQLSMADRYRKFEITVSDTRALERIREPNITQYIKWMEIDSSFLSAADNDLQVMAAQQRTQKSPSTSRSLRKRLSSFVFASKSKQRWTNQSAEPADILAALAANLPHFLQLGEVTLRLDDFLWTDKFSNLLFNIWSQRGQFIRRLHIEATLTGLDDFLEFCSTSLPNLERLSLELLSSRSSYAPSNSAALRSKIIAFIKSHEDTLETFIFHEPTFVTFVDLSILIRDLGFLPKLKEVKIPMVMPSSLLPQLEYLQEFLALHTSTLEHLDLCFRRVYFFMSDPLNIFQQLINNILPTLELPVLHELGIDIYMNEKVRQAFRLPPFTTFAPNIKKLVLRGVKGSLNFVEFKMLLQNLSKINLRSLYLQVDYLCAEHFDLLASQLPMLESLELIYMDLTFIPGAQIPIYPGTYSSLDFKFGAKFDNRRYINWALRYLRLSHRSSCQAGHPRPKVNAMVGMSIPGLEINDTERHCNCLI